MHRSVLVPFTLLWFLLSIAPSRGGDASTADSAKALSVSTPSKRPVKLEQSYARFEGKLCPLERKLFADAADGRLESHSLLTATMIASGVREPAILAQAQQRLAAWRQELAHLPQFRGSPRDRAQLAFEFLHKRILVGGYGRDNTDIRKTLQTGQFNCLSATVLFNSLAAELGLSACGLELPGHVMSRLALVDGPYDVETTCPQWFQLSADPQQRLKWIERARGKREEGPQDHPGREVSPLQLTAMIYYNRGVDLLAEQRFDEALAANAKALRLDQSNATARGNLLAALNNWAINLAAAADFAAAVGRLESGMELDRSYPAFGVNYAHIHYQWVEVLCREREFRKAAQVLQHAASVRPEDGYFRKAMLELYRVWARDRLTAGQWDEVWAVFAEAERVCLNREAWLSGEQTELNRCAVSLLDQQRFADAVRLLQRSLQRHQDSQILAENLRVAAMRWAEEAFANADYVEAIRRTTLGAGAGQLHEALLNNIRYGYRQWAAELASQGRLQESRQVGQRALADPFLGAGLQAIAP